MAAKLPERKGGAAAEIHRHVKAVAYRQIGAAAVRGAPQRQHLPGPHRDRPPVSDRFAVQIGRAAGTRQRDGGVAVKTQRRPLQGKLEPGGRRWLPTMRLASRNAKSSIGPDGGTPMSQ